MAMSAEHKAALVQGRKEAKAIKNYLDALDSRRPGRPVTKNSIEKRLSGVKERLSAEKDTLKRVDLYQVKIELENALDSAGDSLTATTCPFSARSRAPNCARPVTA